MKVTSLSMGRINVVVVVLLVVVVVVVLLLTAKSHTNRSHVSNIFTCIVIYSQTCLSSARNMTFSYRRHNETTRTTRLTTLYYNTHH